MSGEREREEVADVFEGGLFLLFAVGVSPSDEASSDRLECGPHPISALSVSIELILILLQIWLNTFFLYDCDVFLGVYP